MILGFPFLRGRCCCDGAARQERVHDNLAWLSALPRAFLTQVVSSFVMLLQSVIHSNAEIC